MKQVMRKVDEQVGRAVQRLGAEPIPMDAIGEIIEKNLQDTEWEAKARTFLSKSTLEANISKTSFTEPTE